MATRPHIRKVEISNAFKENNIVTIGMKETIT